MLIAFGSGNQQAQESNQNEQVSNQQTQISNQNEQESNQEEQVSNQKQQTAMNNVAPTKLELSAYEPYDYNASYNIDLSEIQDSDVNISPDDDVFVQPVPEIKPTLPSPTTIATTTTAITTTTAATTTITIKTTESATTTIAEKEHVTDDNICSNDTNGEIFFELVEIFDNSEFECSDDLNAKQYQYRSSNEAFEACKEITDCIAVTSTNLVIIATELDSLDFNGETDNEEIVNFMLPDAFDFENHQVFVKQCFSTRETDTDEFKELDTLDCNAEVVCSSGYRQKNFDCVDVNECKLAHDCTFEGKTSHIHCFADVLTYMIDHVRYIQLGSKTRENFSKPNAKIQLVVTNVFVSLVSSHRHQSPGRGTNVIRWNQKKSV